MLRLSPNEIFLSLSDVLEALKKGGRFFFFLSTFSALCAFSYLATRPICFKAEGIFKSHSSQTEAPLYKALEFLGGENSYFSTDDPRVFLKSHPVLEGVVSALNLQATLVEPKSGSRFKEVWFTLKTAHGYDKLKKQKPLSRIQSRAIFVPNKLIVPDTQPQFACSHVCFLAETSSSFKITFLDEKAFSVSRGRKEIGRGTTGTPFIWDEGSFILMGEGKKGVRLALHFIPLEQAIGSLRKKIHVKKNRENSALIHVSFTHRDRHLAAAIVNETMEQYQNYLKNEGKKKITKQLAYLRGRQEETMAGLNEVLQKHTEYLEANLDANMMLSLERELQFMAQKQAEKKQILLETSSEMEYLSLLLGCDKTLPLEKRLETLCTLKEGENLQALTIESARSLIQERQHELDFFFLDNARYDYCLVKLTHSDFDSSSLSKILNDSSLKSRFEKIHAIHRQLIDRENWSEKEKEHLKSELDTERLFLIQHIHHLKEGAELQAVVLQSRIRELQKNLLLLLAGYHEKIEHSLELLNAQVAHFPQKWLSEQKIDLNTKLSIDMMESITKMIEVKNISYHLDYLMASCLQEASPPVIPENPRLILGALLGFLGAALAFFLGMCFYQVWRGPTASVANLQGLHHVVFTGEDAPQRLALALKEGVILIACKKRAALFHTLTQWLVKRGESLLLVDFSEREPYPGCPLFANEPDKQAFLTSVPFKEQLLEWKMRYDRIFLLYTGSPLSFTLEALLGLADSSAYGITDERYAELKTLSTDTLFFYEKSAKTLFSLTEIQPLAANLLRRMKTVSYFSSVKGALDRFLLKKT